MSDDVVKPGRVLVGPGVRGKDVDPVGVALVGQIHHRAGTPLAGSGADGGEEQQRRVTERGDLPMGSPEFGDVLLVEGQRLLLVHDSVLAFIARVRRLPRVATESNTSSSKRTKSSTCKLP